MTDMQREKGAEEGTTTCPTCGAELELKAQPDGSVAAETCSKCYGGDGDADAEPNAGYGGPSHSDETPVEAPPNPDGQPAPGDAPQGPASGSTSTNGDTL